MEAQNWRAGTSGPECDFSALPTDALTPQCSFSVQKVPWSHSYLHRQHQTDCSRPTGEHVSIYSDQSFMCIKKTSGNPLVEHHQVLPPCLPFPHSVVSLQHTEKDLSISEISWNMVVSDARVIIKSPSTQ